MSRSTRLTMICRGRTASTRAAGFSSDEPLVEGETIKAAAIASRLRRYDRLLCAPERSARETAAVIGDNATIVPALSDLDCGRWHGLTLTDVATAEPAALEAWIGDPHAAPHGGESLAELADRLTGWLRDNLNAGGHTVAVTHPLAVRSAIVSVLDAPTISVWKIDVPLLGITEFSSDGRRWVVRSMGMDKRGKRDMSKNGLPLTPQDKTGLEDNLSSN